MQARHELRRLAVVFAALALAACSTALPPEQRVLAHELPAAQRDAARRVPLEGAHNFRDLGGYETSDGKRVKWGVLYRSDALGDLTDDDVETLARLQLKRVVDFRSETERERDADRLPENPGPNVAWTPIQGDALDPHDIQEMILSGDATEEGMSQLLVVANESFITQFGDVYAEFLRNLSQRENLPTLFHCTAGKDRAGFGAALALMALGVPRATIMQDYLKTNAFTAEHTESRLRLIRWVSLFRADPDAIRPLFEARPEYLQAAFDTIDAKYGSTEAYLSEGLGIDAQTQARLRANLLE
jgi:protein-tyrosine phosphatase